MDATLETRAKPKSLFLLRVVDAEVAPELCLGPSSWSLHLALGGEDHRYSPSTQQEFAWEVSHLEGRHLQLRLSLMRKVLLGISQQLGEAVVPVDGLLQQLRAGSLSSAVWLDLVGATRRKGRVRLSFRLSFSSSESFTYLADLHEAMLRFVLEEDSCTGSDSALSSLDSQHMRPTAGLSGYLLTVAPQSRSTSQRSDAPSVSEAVAAAAAVSHEFAWVMAPTAAQVAEALKEAESSGERLRSSRRFVATLAGVLASRERLRGLLEGEAEDSSLLLVDLMLAGLRNSNLIMSNLRQVASRHVKLGMEPDDYSPLGHAVLAAVMAVEEPAGCWSRAVEQAWRLAYTLVASTLKELARPQLMRLGRLPPVLGCAMAASEEEELTPRCSFNERFQTALQKIWKNYRDGEGWVEMAEVAKDFEEAAQMYGRVIILEKFLPDYLKTIKPLYSGTIGGIKYVHGGIFFKFAFADGMVIESMEGAAKVAGHDLKGCSCYFQANVANLHVPLMSCIDFAGFRLVAMCELPISSSTLVVGTNDGGKTIAATDTFLLVQLKAAAKILNLREHHVGRLLFTSAADLEGHFSHLDGRRYLLDFSRAMPPDPEAGRRGGEERFVRLLRPELVQQAPEPLNPDAFSGFHGTDRTATEEAADCRGIEAAAEMLKELCESVAKEVTQKAVECGDNEDMLAALQDSLSRILHTRGVNVRMLGAVYARSNHLWARRVLAVEMASRVVKRVVRARWRKLMASAEYVMSGALLHATSECFNEAFSSSLFWSRDVYPEMERYFNFRWSPADAEASPVAGADGGPVLVHKKRQGRSSLAPRISRSRVVSAPTMRSPAPDTPSAAPESVAATAAAAPSTAAVPAASFPGGGAAEDEAGGRYGSWRPLYDNRVMRWLLFRRLKRQLGVEMSGRVASFFGGSGKTIVMHASDVVNMAPRLKSLKIVHQCCAMAMVARSDAHPDREQFLQTVTACFEKALEAPLVSSQLLRSYAECLMHFCPAAQGSKLLSTELGDRVESLYRKALQVNPRDADTRCSYARWRELCGDTDGARLHLLHSITLSPVTLLGAQAYLALLKRLRMSREAAALEDALARRELSQRL